MRYHRASIPGAYFFYTVNLAQRNKSQLVDNIDVVHSAFKQVKKNHAFAISATVVFPAYILKYPCPNAQNIASFDDNKGVFYENDDCFG